MSWIPRGCRRLRGELSATITLLVLPHVAVIPEAKAVNGARGKTNRTAGRVNAPVGREGDDYESTDEGEGKELDEKELEQATQNPTAERLREVEEEAIEPRIKKCNDKPTPRGGRGTQRYSYSIPFIVRPL